MIYPCQFSIYVGTRKSREPNFSDLKFHCRMIFHKMGAISSINIHVSQPCMMANVNFPLVQFPLTIPLHPRFGFNIQTWLHLKTFLQAHSHVVTFLHIKVNNVCCEFSSWFSFPTMMPLHPRCGLNIQALLVHFCTGFMCHDLSTLKNT